MKRLIVCGGLALAACGARGDIAPPDDGGPSLVSLNPCADAILAQVADPAQILAISHYSHDPRASSMDLALARQWPATGGTAEEVLALRPDIVVAGAFLPPATARAFADMGIQVETIGMATSARESAGQIRHLAGLAGHVRRGEALIATIDTALEQSAAPENSAPVSALLWQEGAIVAGEDSLIARLLDHTGFSSHSAARGLGQGAYVPLEMVLADPPELILAAGDNRAQTHPALKALENTQYAQFDPALIYCAGPSIIPAVETLAHIRSRIKP